MSFKLEGKKAFITGSTYGIGLSILKKLKDYGCDVALNSRSRKSIEDAKEILGNNIYGITGDMSKKDNAKKAINEFIYKYGSLDILICNVGSGRSANPLEETPLDWEESISKNLMTAINPISEAFDFLAQSEGSIVCISSICSQKMIDGAPLTYSSAKASLNRYVKNSSYYFAKNKIRINAVSPGNVYFRGSIWEKKLENNQKSVEVMLKEKVPLNKFVAPEDVAEAVAFLASPLSISTTGQILTVDAGQIIL